MGPTADPSGAGKAWFPGLCAEHWKVYASSVGWEPSPGWRAFLKQHASAIWACDFLCGRTVFFQTLYVFFVVDHANREVLHVQTTRHPTAEWASRQIIECCGWDREPPRFLIHDRDGRYGAVFDRRVRALGITQIRTPFRSPQANSIAERWVGSLRRECLDYVFIFNESRLRAVLAEYARYLNDVSCCPTSLCA